MQGPLVCTPANEVLGQHRLAGRRNAKCSEGGHVSVMAAEAVSLELFSILNLLVPYVSFALTSSTRLHTFAIHRRKVRRERGRRTWEIARQSVDLSHARKLVTLRIIRSSVCWL